MTTPPMTDLDKLEALAKAALKAKGDNARWEALDALEAAANPATILDLIASARRDAEEIERLRAAVDQAIQCLCTRIPGGVLHGDETMSILRAARAAHTGEG